MKRLPLMLLMIVMCSTGIANATDECPGTNAWVFVGPVDSSFFTSNNVNNTSIFAARAEANAACAQMWNWASNQVSEVGTWWSEVTAGPVFWQYRCKVCITGYPPRWADHRALRNSNVTMEEAIERAVALTGGIAVSAKLQIADNLDLDCGLHDQPNELVVIVTEEHVLRQVSVNLETGEATLVR